MAKYIPSGVEYISGAMQQIDHPDGSYTITREVIPIHHLGYVKHDWALHTYVHPDEWTTYAIDACDLLKAENGCMFAVTVREIGDEHNFDIEHVPVQTKEAAEALYHQKCAEHAAKKE